MKKLLTLSLIAALFILAGCAPFSGFILGDALNLAASRDGKHLFMALEYSGGMDTFKYELVRTNLSGDEIKIISVGMFDEVIESSSGKYLLATSGDVSPEKTTIKIYDTRTLKMINRLTVNGLIVSIFWYPNSDKIAYSTGNGIFTLDLLSKKPSELLKGAFNALAINSAEDNLLFTADIGDFKPRDVLILNLASGQSYPVDNISASVDSAAFTKDGAVIYTAIVGEKSELRTVPKGAKNSMLLKTVAGSISNLNYDPASNYAIYGMGADEMRESVFKRDLNTGEENKIVSGAPTYSWTVDTARHKIIYAEVGSTREKIKISEKSY